jgi:hypothetical protein
MSVTFGVESLHGVKGECEALFADHYEELTLDKHAVKLNPIWDEYAALESIGKLLIFTARDGEKLVGYSVFFVRRHMHYADLTVAQNDILFLDKEYRFGRTGIRLIQHSEQQIKERLSGQLKIVWHIKEANDWSAIILRQGYQLEDSIYGKLLRA